MTIALCLGMVGLLGVLLYRGTPVFAALGSTAACFAVVGVAMGYFTTAYLEVVALRVFGIVSNQLLVSIPFFILMGLLLQNSGLAGRLLTGSAQALRALPGGLAISVVLVGTLLAAASGVVAASVISMGVITLPAMLKAGYPKPLATGVVAAAGTLGQIVPPSIVLILLADQAGVSVGSVFAAAFAPALLLASCYIFYVSIYFVLSTHVINQNQSEESSYSIVRLLVDIAVPVSLIVVVLGSIFLGIATPSESGALGAAGVAVFGLATGELDWEGTRKSLVEATKLSSMVIMLLIGSTLFVVVFKGFGGHSMISSVLTSLPGGEVGLIILLCIIFFTLGFVLDFFEIVFIVFPLVIPVAVAMNINISKLCVLVALVIQTSFLTPPFGFSLFFLGSVVPRGVAIGDIYEGVISFVVIQLVVVVMYVTWWQVL